MTQNRSTLFFFARFSTIFAIFLLGNSLLGAPKFHPKGSYKILKTIKGVDPPLREWSQYTIQSDDGRILNMRDASLGWPRNLLPGTNVKVEEENIYIDGKPYLSAATIVVFKLFFWLGVLCGLIASIFWFKLASIYKTQIFGTGKIWHK